jgi:hypothetical protein
MSMRGYRCAFFVALLFMTRCNGCCCDNDKCGDNGDGGDAPPSVGPGAADGGCGFDGSCGHGGEAVCDQIASTYCAPFLTGLAGGAAPTECALYACTSSANDKLNPHPDAGPPSDSDRRRAANYLTACAASASGGPITGFNGCLGDAVRRLTTAAEKGSVAPAGALTIPGDLAQRVRCAYATCPSLAGPCFGDDLDGGGFPTAGGAADSCLGYRLCLADCRQNIVDTVRRGQCVLEQCDPRFPNGRQQFLAYRKCLVDAPPSCASWDPLDGGTDGP